MLDELNSVLHKISCRGLLFELKNEAPALAFEVWELVSLYVIGTFGKALENGDSTEACVARESDGVL